VGPPRGFFPLGLGRQPLALRLTIGFGIKPADAVDRLLGPIEVDILRTRRWAFTGFLASLVFRVGDLVLVHPKGLQPDLGARAGVLRAFVGAADERTTRDAGHLLRAVAAG